MSIGAIKPLYFPISTQGDSMHGRFCCRCINQLDTGLGTAKSNVIEVYEERERLFGFRTRSIFDLPECMNECFYHQGKPKFKSARTTVRRYFSSAYSKWITKGRKSYVKS